MFLKIRRLCLRPFGGKLNLITTLLIALAVYLVVRTYFFSGPGHDISDRLEVQNIHNGNRGAEKQPMVFDKECEMSEKCSDDAYPYKVVSGEGYDKQPVICFNGKLLVGKSAPNSKTGRGMNVVLVREQNKSYTVEGVERFDTYAEDASFFRYLKTSTKDGDVILMASYDEVANSLRDLSINFLEFFGVQSIRQVKFRDSYAMVAQRGIAKGKAIEVVGNKGAKEFGAEVKSIGCLKFPLGPITTVPMIEPQINSRNQIVVGSIVKNCGLPEPCPKGEFSVHIYTGANDKDEPKICVDDKYIMGKDLNDAGRGINIVVIGNGKEILKTAHFDTYQEDSTNLEIFLENLYDNVIVIFCTFDEASAKLGQLAKNLLFDLGSGLIQNLKHRDAWYMVGQKGIVGFSPIEDISYAGSDSAYPAPLNKRFCVPQTLQGMKIRPDPLPVVNEKRREFCSKFDGYGDFCFDHNIDKQIRPAPLINKTLEDHPLYSVPILVIAGLSHNALRMSLETIVMQPGINQELVYVALDEKLEESAALVKLFGFNVLMIPSSVKYIDQMHKSIDRIWSENATKEKETVIVIEEDIIVSPDFLYFFSQVYDTFLNDDSLAAVSAWNSNSFSEPDGSANFVYRANDFPGFGFLLKKSVYEKFMKGNWDKCCSSRAWYSWSIDKSLNTLIPDVSRCYRRPYNGINADMNFLDNLFNRQRKTNLLPFPEIYNLEDLVNKETYEKAIRNDLKKYEEYKDLKNCFSTGAISYPRDKWAKFKIVYEQTSVNDYTTLKKLCKCFGLFHDETHEPMGLYNGVLRFHALGNDYILIGSRSPLLN